MKTKIIDIAVGTQSAYTNLWWKNTKTFYITTDTHNIYLGHMLVFSEDKFSYLVIGENSSVDIITYGTGGSITVSLADYETNDEVIEAITNATSKAYKVIGYITSKDITSDLLTSGKEGGVYIVNDEFSVGDRPGQIDSDFFVDRASGNSYSLGTGIVVVNTGTSDNPVYKFDVLSESVNLDNYKVKQSPKSDPQASGETLDVIDSIIQDVNGEITATKKTIQLASSSQSGIITKEMYTKIDDFNYDDLDPITLADLDQICI